MSVRRFPPELSICRDAQFLHANDTVYSRLVKNIEGLSPQKSPEVVLQEVARAALLASQFHPGRFADGAIENVAFEIGRALESQEPDRRTCASRGQPLVSGTRRIVHVATNVSSIGGHTRLIDHWIKLDRSSTHSLVLIDQGDLGVPVWLADSIRRSGGTFVAIPKGGICQKALLLRGAVRDLADLVVLHHHPSDVVPVVALASIQCPAVAMFHHADHQFSLGSSVADVAICFRSVGSDYATMRRAIANTVVLPIPLTDLFGRDTRRDARIALGIPPDQIMLLTVGRGEKYRPSSTHDFVRTAGRTLDRLPAAHMYLIGETRSGIAPYLHRPVHDRLHFVGAVEDPSLWRAAADVYLESFPFGSHTALLEAGLNGLAVVPAYAPIFPLIVANDDSLHGFVSNPQSEEDYIEMCVRLAQCPGRRSEIGSELRRRLQRDHVGSGWLRRLAAVYEVTDGLIHAPAPIPRAECIATEADISLSLWHARTDARQWTSVGRRAGAALCHAAFVARSAVDYGAALGFVARALWVDPWRRASWLELALAVLGRRGASAASRLRHYVKQKHQRVAYD